MSSSPFLTPEEIALRWKTTTATLSQWRWNGKGPLYTKIGRGILYKLEDVEQFEKQKVRRDTTSTGYETVAKEDSLSELLKAQDEDKKLDDSRIIK